MRDAETMPALREAMTAREQMLESSAELLARGFNARGRRRQRLHASLRLVLDFSTWRTLTAAGLDDEAAAALAEELVAAAAGPA